MGFIWNTVETALVSLGLLNEEEQRLKREKAAAHQAKLQEHDHKITQGEKECRELPKARFETTTKVSNAFKTLKDDQERDLKNLQSTLGQRREALNKKVVATEASQKREILDQKSKLDELDRFLQEQLQMKKDTDHKSAKAFKKVAGSYLPKGKNPAPLMVDSEPKVQEPKVQEPKVQESKPSVRQPTPSPASSAPLVKPLPSKPTNSKNLQLIVGGVFGVLIAILVSLMLHLALRR